MRHKWQQATVNEIRDDRQLINSILEIVNNNDCDQTGNYK